MRTVIGNARVFVRTGIVEPYVTPLIRDDEKHRRGRREIHRRMDVLRMVVDRLRDRHDPPEGGLGGGPPALD